MTYPTSAITTGWQPPYSVSNLRDETAMIGNRKSHSELITIDDIDEVEVPSMAAIKMRRYLSFMGIIPSITSENNVTTKLVASGLIAAFVSTYLTNSFLYSICLLMSVLNFVTSLFIDKSIENRAKIGTFVADWVLMGVVVVIAQIVMGSVVTIPFTQFSSPIILIVLTYFTISYIWQITNRLLPFSTITKSGTLGNLVHALQCGWKAFADDFEKQQIKNLGKKSKRNSK